MSVLNSPQSNIIAMIDHVRATSKKNKTVRGRGDTLDLVADEVGTSRNTLARVKANPKYRVKENLECAIADAAFEMFEYPWSFQAEMLCQEIKNAMLEPRGGSFAEDPVRRRWNFLIGEGVIGTLKAAPAGANCERTEEDWGLLICSYVFQVAVCFQERREQVTQDRDDDTLEFLSRRLFDWLQPHSDHLWAFFLEFQVLSNLIGLRWNNTPKEKRCSQEMRELIFASRYFELLFRYNALCPRDSAPIENALAYVSRLGEPMYFARFRELLVVAYMGEEPAYTEENGFDDDFDGFRRWLASVSTS